MQPTLAAAPAPWSLARRILFRFLCVYFVLYALPTSGRSSLVFALPFGYKLSKPYVTLWQSLCAWTGAHIFHLSGRAITYVMTGSGDTTLDYLQLFLFVVFASIAAVIWSILDRKRPDYRTLDAWLRVLLRYTLAFTLFSYGFAKIVPLQFRAPGFSRLLETYGEFSPMGTLWSFMGASIPYTVFAGAAEVTGGLLLLFRRTALVGALVSFGVLLNVMMLNYCYDVPVKLYSTNLVLMSLYIASSGFRSLFNLLLLNRATTPLDLTVPRFSRRWARVFALVFQVLFVGYGLFEFVSGAWRGYQRNYVKPEHPPIYGLYEVESFTRNGQEVPPLITDGTRWHRVIAEFASNLTIRMANDSVRGYGAQYDASKSVVTLWQYFDKEKKYPLTYTRPDPDHLTLEGTLVGDRLAISLKKIDTTKFLLLNRGFHWIQETPFNR